MSRWRHDPEGAAADLVRRSLPSLGLAGRVLVANASANLIDILRSEGLEVTRWSRRAIEEGDAASPWPPPEPFDAVLLRLAKSKAEQEMAAHAALSVLAPGGRLILCGGNDEGIRSGATLLESKCGAIDTLSTRGHGRIVAARRPDALEGLKSRLVDWRSVIKLEIAGRARDWVTYPGLFAADRLDEGTELLLAALPPIAAGSRVLDYGCGSGAIAATIAASVAEPRLDLVDNDSVALEAARANVPTGRIILGNSLAAAPQKVRYDAILSNPPLHSGLAEDRAHLERLIAEAPKHLRSGGLLQIVVQRRAGPDKLLQAKFGEVSVVAENGLYRVWRAKAG